MTVQFLCVLMLVWCCLSQWCLSSLPRLKILLKLKVYIQIENLPNFQCMSILLMCRGWLLSQYNYYCDSSQYNGLYWLHWSCCGWHYCSWRTPELHYMCGQLLRMGGHCWWWQWELLIIKVLCKSDHHLFSSLRWVWANSLHCSRRKHHWSGHSKEGRVWR